jgi:GH15 family glucan-1,4-alpha-glucosidase
VNAHDGDTFSLGQPHVLREYAFVADGERGALIGPRGEVAWMCFPGWDSDPLFASLLGAPALYAVSPVGPSVWGGHYEAGSMVWRGRWASGDALTECLDALAYPGDPQRAVLLRRVEGVRGSAQLRIVLDLRTDWGRTPLSLRQDGDGVWTGRAGPLRVRWSGASAARPSGRDGALAFELTLSPGDHHDLVLELSTADLDARLPDADALWESTLAAWRRALPEMPVPAARDARHAHAVLRGLTTSSGGMVACATTSLPERATEGREFDYRYVWIRDQCYAGQAAAAAGIPDLLNGAARFAAERLLADGPGLRPMYRPDGTAAPDDSEVDLPGYPGAPDVHSGNAATSQFQLDSFGEALLLFAVAAATEQTRNAATVAADAVERRWRERDAGVWELQPREWTHSRLVCVSGLRRAAQTPGLAGDAATARRWLDLATAIEEDAAVHCVHRSGRWQRAPDDERVDAALLIPAIRGAISADDPRSVATLDAVRRDLSRDGFVYRYGHPGTPLHEAEGAFLLCTFWTAMAELQQGHTVDAVRRFERARTACGPPGLFSEEFDVEQRQMRGNLPQAFVHAVMLECAAVLRDVAGAEL